MSGFEILLLPFALVGHLGIWCAVFNQVHATGWPRWLRKTTEKLTYLTVVGGALLLTFPDLSGKTGVPYAEFYQWLCLSACGLLSLRWLIRMLFRSEPEEASITACRTVDIGALMQSPRWHGTQAWWLSRVPGNQSLFLSIESRDFRLPGWPAGLDGLKVAHLSDLHFNGKISREYFEKVVEQCNAWQPDVVLLTGDIVDKAACLDWIPDTLAHLESALGKFYILGNHDQRIRDVSRLHTGMEKAGFQRASSQWRSVDFGGQRFFLAGDEQPWFEGGKNLVGPPGPAVLLAHSPDRIDTASRLGIDLVLAGHCHGGQIRVPWVGAVVSPSKYGVRFASGTFKIRQTLMHVSRGVSADDPIRLNCPPELSLICLRSPQ